MKLKPRARNVAHYCTNDPRTFMFRDFHQSVYSFFKHSQYNLYTIRINIAIVQPFQKNFKIFATDKKMVSKMCVEMNPVLINYTMVSN